MNNRQELREDAGERAAAFLHLPAEQRPLWANLFLALDSLLREREEQLREAEENQNACRESLTQEIRATLRAAAKLREAEEEIERLRAKWQKSEEWISELEETILGIKARAEKAEAERDEWRQKCIRARGERDAAETSCGETMMRLDELAKRITDLDLPLDRGSLIRAFEGEVTIEVGRQEAIKRLEAERDALREELERRCGQGGTVPEL